MRVLTPPRALTLAIALVAALATTLAPAAESAEPAAPRRLAVVLLQFSDSKLTNVDELRARARSTFFDAPDSMAWYFETQSQGARRTVPADEGVFGPYTVDSKAVCDVGLLDREATARVANAKADDVAIVFPNEKAGCGWGGMGQKPGSRSWYPADGVGAGTALHEVGHNLGFPHQARAVCATGSFTDCRHESHSFRSPMGGGGPQVGLSAPELIAKGWLPTDRRASPTAGTTVRLTPVHAPHQIGGTRAIDVPLGDKGDRLVVEYRVPSKNTVDRSVWHGVNVYRVPAGNYFDSRIIDPSPGQPGVVDNSMPVGLTLADTAAKVSVTVADATQDAAEVRIAFGDSAPPTSTPQAAPATTAPVSPAPSQPSAQKANDRLHNVPDTVPSTEPQAAQAPLAATGAPVSPGLLVLLGVGLVVTGTLVTTLALRRRRRS